MSKPQFENRQRYAVIFDMDGVIVRNKEFHEKAWIEFGKKYGKKVTKEDFEKSFGSTNRDYIRTIMGKELNNEEIDKLGEEKEQIYRRLYSREIVPVYGLIDLLKLLRINLCYKTAIATSGPRTNVEFVLDKLGFIDFFDALVDSSMIKNGKPQPDVFIKASELLGIPPERCLVFEDSPHGIEAAIKANMKVVGLPTSFPESQIKRANMIIADFTEVNLADIYELINSF